MKKQTKKSKIISLLFNGIEPAQIAKQVKCPIQTVYSVRYEQKKKAARKSTFQTRVEGIQAAHATQYPKKKAKPSLKQAILDTIIAKQNKGMVAKPTQLILPGFAAAEVKKEGDLVKHHEAKPTQLILPSIANSTQVNGTHYMRKTIQPWDAITDWKLGFLDGNVVKYMARWKDKGGVADLRKAKHYLDKLIELEGGE